jgi:hypothetical protein
LAAQLEITLALAGKLIAQKAEGCFCHRKTLVARMIRPAALLPLWVHSRHSCHPGVSGLFPRGERLLGRTIRAAIPPHASETGRRRVFGPALAAGIFGHASDTE